MGRVSEPRPSRPYPPTRHRGGSALAPRTLSRAPLGGRALAHHSLARATCAHKTKFPRNRPIRSDPVRGFAPIGPLPQLDAAWGTWPTGYGWGFSLRPVVRSALIVLGFRRIPSASHWGKDSYYYGPPDAPRDQDILLNLALTENIEMRAHIIKAALFSLSIPSCWA